MTVCKLAGCRKKAHPDDPYCTRACATLDQTGMEINSPTTGGVNTSSASGAAWQAYKGKPVPVTPLMVEAADRDRQARARVAVEVRRAREARAQAARLELARKRGLA